MRMMAHRIALTTILAMFILLGCGKLGEDMVTVEEVHADPEFVEAIVNVEELHLPFVAYSEASYPENPTTGACQSSVGELGCQCNADGSCDDDLYECSANANGAKYCKTRSANGMIRAFNRLAKWESFLFTYLNVLKQFENAKPSEQSETLHVWDLQGLAGESSRYEPKLVLEKTAGMYAWKQTVSARVYNGQEYSEEEVVLFMIDFNKAAGTDEGIGDGVIQFNFNALRAADPYTTATGILTITFDMNKSDPARLSNATYTELVLGMTNFQFDFEDGELYADVTETYRAYHNDTYDPTDPDNHPKFWDGTYAFNHTAAFYPSGVDTLDENYRNFMQWSFLDDNGQVLSDVRSADLTGASIDHVWLKECWGVDPTYGGQGLLYRVYEKYLMDESGIVSSIPEKDQEIGSIMNCMDSTFSQNPF